MDLKNLLGLKKPDIKKMEMEHDIEGLTKLLKFENDESVRREAAFSIGKITGPNTDSKTKIEDSEISESEPSVEDLIDSLKDDNLNVQKNSAMALVDIGEPAVKPLIKSLETKKWRARWYAVEILGEIGDKAAVDPLIKLLQDENNGVRSNSIIALVLIGKASVKPLIKALKDGNWQVRWNAAEALGELGDKTAARALIKTLNDENFLVKKTAAASLGNIGDENAVEPLKNLLNDEDIEVSTAALRALNKIS